MIKIEDLKEKDKGRAVTYTDGVGDKEYGHIPSWNHKYIFVDYGLNCDQGGIATDPKDLIWG